MFKRGRMSSTKTKWLRPTTVAERLDISKRAAYRLIESGAIVAARFGQRCIRVREDSLNDYIRRQEAAFSLETGRTNQL